MDTGLNAGPKAGPGVGAHAGSGAGLDAVRRDRRCGGARRGAPPPAPPIPAPRPPAARPGQRQRGRGRAAVIALASCAALGLGTGMMAPGSPAAAASRCDHVAKDNRPELREGDRDDAVAQVQCLIDTRSGAPGELPDNGVFDAATADAVRWVQKCNTLEPSGVTDAATWKVLYRAKKGCGKKAEQAVDTG
ncbi:peptidoglycan-binding domain-containing protein [Embleya sp. NPDC005971]|uniref:peptidoglycan-binding domain-containing protein n=1 Tax=Embleya sp. NPDC005971 TaxID=3156724 RepID=UPI0033F4ABF7